MNSNTIQENWNVIKGKIRQQWGKLTDGDVDDAKEDLDKIVGSIEKTYGYPKEQARKEYENFRDRNLNLLTSIPGDEEALPPPTQM